MKNIVLASEALKSTNMKPNNQKAPIQAAGEWKKDYHLHDRNHHKIGNWWEELSEECVGRNTVKQKIKNELSKEEDK